MSTKIWNELTKQKLISEIDMCLERNDLSHINYTILSSLR